MINNQSSHVSIYTVLWWIFQEEITVIDSLNYESTKYQWSHYELTLMSKLRCVYCEYFPEKKHDML